ncbi:MAG: NifB/NifX family molybdenum-iron cluster-binding protein [Candidatus Thorarchaeota archaeon]
MSDRIMKKILGLTSNGPDLIDTISEHFGHCNYFIGIEIDANNNYKKIFSLKNHGHTSCMEPVINMVERNVKDMIIGGIGGRPYIGFTQYNIKLHKAVNGSLKDNIELYLQGKLEPLIGPMCAGH